MPVVKYSDYPAWIAEYAPEMPENPKATKGHGTKELPELKPWSYYSKYFWGFDPVTGLLYYEADGRTKLAEPLQTTDAEYREIVDAQNFYRNNGLTPAGRKDGLDPAVLAGCSYDYDEEAYRGNNGKLYYIHEGPKSSNNNEGQNATMGDWTGDLYTGEPFNSTYASIYPDHSATEVS